MIVKWRIWYDDGSVFDSTDGDPEDAPLDGVIAIGEEDDTGKKQIYSGRDYYQWMGDGWRAGELSSLEKWLRKEMPSLKYGRWAPMSFYQRLRALARKEWL